jgi:hypothetical protein
MENNELGTIKQKLIKELLKELKEPKDFLDLIEEIKNALVDKVNKAFEREKPSEWNLEVAIPGNSKDISRLIAQQEELVDGIYNTAFEMRIRGIKWPDIRSSLKELYEKDMLVLVQSILTTAITNVVNELEEFENEK